MPQISRTLAAATAVLLAAGILVTRWEHFEPDPGHTTGWCSQLLTAIAFGFVGVALGERVTPPANRVAWILQTTGLTQAAGLVAGSWARHPGLPGTGAAHWLDGWVWAPGVLPVVTVLLLIFPSGRPMPGPWRAAARAAIAAAGHRNPVIAQRLRLSPKTVRNLVSSAMSKLQVPDRTGLALLARSRGLGTDTF